MIATKSLNKTSLENTNTDGSFFCIQFLLFFFIKQLIYCNIKPEYFHILLHLSYNNLSARSVQIKTILKKKF